MIIVRRSISLVDRIPNNLSALVFLLLAIVGSTTLLIPGARSIALLGGTVLSFVLTLISPVLPYDYHLTESYRRRWTIFWISYAITLFFCLIANAAFAIYAGTFFGKELNRLYFWQDYFNIIQWAAVVPAYVGMGICLVSTVIDNRPRLRKLAEKASGGEKPETAQTQSPFWFSKKANRIRFSGSIVLSLLITGVLISTFINDALDPRKVTEIYWFVRQVDGENRVLNEAGAYYLMMNAGVLFVTCIVTLSYLAISIEVIRISNNFQNMDLAKKLVAAKTLSAKRYVTAVAAADNKLAQSLNEFAWCYTLAKLIVVFYALNIILWKMSPLGSVANVDIGVVALSLVGILVIPFPRLLLEYRWHKFKYGWKGPSGPKYKDTRSHRQMILSRVSNAVFFTLIFYVIEDRYGTLKHWLGYLWPFLKWIGQSLGT